MTELRSELIIETAYGTVKGAVEGAYQSFKGIPYAKAERFRAPRACSWDGILDCTGFGKKAMQVYDGNTPWQKPQKREEFSEDCLNLNIYLPNHPKQETKKLPVLIEVHGGAYQNGSNQERTPEEVIRDQEIIYVPINYRLGTLGYLYLGAALGDKFQTTGNNGLLDQLAACRWVYENIAAFGGDPERITVLGSSAGAKSIGGLLLIPEFNRYVKQVILSSGATQSVRTTETAQKITDEFLEILTQKQFASADLSDPKQLKQVLLSLTLDEIIAVQKVLCDNPGNTCMFGPVADGQIISDTWEEAAEQGTFWEGRAMIGCSRHELDFYPMMDPAFSEHAPAITAALFGKNTAIAEAAYQTLCRQHGREEQLSKEQKNAFRARILTDYMYRMYSYHLADRMSRRGLDVWQYSVDFKPALHCFDQTLAFTLGTNPMLPKALQKDAAAIGADIHQSFINFIKDGTPGIDPDWVPRRLHQTQMYWNLKSEVREIPDDDVLEGFPESVYIL